MRKIYGHIVILEFRKTDRWYWDFQINVTHILNKLIPSKSSILFLYISGARTLNARMVV